MTDHDRGFVATAIVKPTNFVMYDSHSWFCYMHGRRTGVVTAGIESCYYVSVDGGGKLFPSLRAFVDEYQRIAKLAEMVWPELVGKTKVAA